MLDDIMWRQGVLHARQMKSTFEMLRSRDLIWSYRVMSHLLGERPAFKKVSEDRKAAQSAAVAAGG